MELKTEAELELGKIVDNLRANVLEYRRITRCSDMISLKNHLTQMREALDSYEQNTRTSTHSNGPTKDPRTIEQEYSR